MKGVSNNPALSAYQRMAVKPISATQAAGKTEQVTHSSTPRPQDAAKVSISSEARELAGAAGGVRTEKVAALKAAISDGSFKVDSTAIATRLVDEVG